MSGRYYARRLVNEGSQEDVPPVQMGGWIATKTKSTLSGRSAAKFGFPTADRPQIRQAPTKMGRSPVAPLMTASDKSFRSVVVKLFRSNAPQVRTFRHELSEARKRTDQGKDGRRTGRRRYHERSYDRFRSPMTLSYWFDPTFGGRVCAWAAAKEERVWRPTIKRPD